MANDVTLDDVALKSGVSRATASRALNGRDGVRVDVRERVTLVAKALGYRPNRAAKNLAGGRTSVIGLILGTDELRSDVYGASLVQAVAKAADAADEGLMVLMDSKRPSDSVANLLRDGLVEGVIVSAVAIGERWIEQLLDAKLPTVLVGAHPRRQDVVVVDVENLESSAAIVGHMLDSGCERVGIISGPLGRVDAQLRLKGYHAAHQRRGLVPAENLQFEGDFSRLSGFEIADSVIDASVDAVFAANDEMALGFVRRLTQRGMNTPADVCVAGFDGTSTTEIGVPKLSTVEQPFDQLAAAAVGSLVALINGDDVLKEQLIVPKISYGETTERPDA